MVRHAAGRRVTVGLDVGTSSVKAVVAAGGQPGDATVVGMGIADASGMRRGVVVHPDAVVSCIRAALADAELTAGIRIGAVHVAISGSHLCSLNSRGIVAVASAARLIARADVERAIDVAAAMAMPPGREIVRVIPQDFVVDDQDGVIDPIGMTGTRLEVNLHVISGNPNSIENLLACVMRAGVGVEDTIVGQIATADAVLTRDEKALGAAVVDIGGGTTSLAIFERGSLSHTAVVPRGGDHLTTDLAVALRTPIAEAERLKRRYGRARALSIDQEEMIPVQTIGTDIPRDVSRRVISDVVTEWIQSLLDRVWDEIRAAGYADRLTAGLIFTGGTSVLGGLPDAAETMFDVPSRRASPSLTGCVADLVNAPAFSTAAGLVLLAARDPLVAPEASRPLDRVAWRLRSLLRVFH